MYRKKGYIKFDVAIFQNLNVISFLWTRFQYENTTEVLLLLLYAIGLGERRNVFMFILIN